MFRDVISSRPFVVSNEDRIYITDVDIQRLLPEQGTYAMKIMLLVRAIENAVTHGGAFSLCRQHTSSEPTFRAAFRRARKRSLRTQNLRISHRNSSPFVRELWNWADGAGIRLYAPLENPFLGTAFE